MLNFGTKRCVFYTGGYGISTCSCPEQWRRQEPPHNSTAFSTNSLPEMRQDRIVAMVLRGDPWGTRTRRDLCAPSAGNDIRFELVIRNFQTQVHKAMAALFTRGRSSDPVTCTFQTSFSTSLRATRICIKICAETKEE